MATAFRSLNFARALAVGLGLVACTSAASKDGNGGDEATGVTIAITAPVAGTDGALPLVSGLVTVTGTLSYDAGVTPGQAATIEIVGIDTSRVDCAMAGAAFICRIDSAALLDGKPAIACNSQASLRVRASGTANGAPVGSSADADVIVDNCPPVAAITAPDDNLPFIGQLTIDAQVADDALVEAHLTVTDPAGQSVLTQPVDLPPGTTTWKPHVRVNLDATTLTQDLKITLTAIDAVGLKTQVVRTATSVKRPYFLGSDQDVDRFDPSDGKSTVPLDAAITDFVLGADLVSFADTPPLAKDNLVDAVVGTVRGLVVRAGLPVRDATGTAAGAPNFQPSGLFDNPSQTPALAAVRVIEDQDPVKIARVFLQDLDGDGDQDILAVGTTMFDTGVAWAVLNLTRKVAGGPPLAAFKLVATRPLPAPPLSAALGDLNADDVADLLIGAASADVGLMTLLIQKAPMCTPVDGTADKLCAQFSDFDQVKAAHIFAPDAQTTVHKGVTGISSIAVADFYKDDKQLNDVCVGETARGIISCYRNVTHDGKLAQAQDSYTFADALDTHAIVAAEFSGIGDGPDLIVQSTTGKFVRWLTGDHNGGFKFVEDNVPTRNIIGLGCSTLGTGLVGPGGLNGKPYLTAISDLRKVTIIPTQLDDLSHALQCFRAWVLGSHLTKVAAADINGDGAPDLIALDVDQPGLVVAFGQRDGSGVFNGNFIAPDAHHICAQDRKPHGYGVYDIAEAVVGDLDGDQRLDLTLISAQGGTVTGETCPPGPSSALSPVWTLAVFLNTVDGVVNPQPRQGEFAPYADADAGRVGCDEIGAVHAARTGDVNGDGVADLVTVRQDPAYFVGDDENPCGCSFNEATEVDNLFGAQCAAAGCTTAPDSDCRNFADTDTCHGKPLVGYGGGAPLLRASGMVFASTANGPFGMTAACRVGQVCHVAPGFGFAAGVDPQGIVLNDLNHDGKLDVATAMEARDEACVGDNRHYLAPRVRVFQGDGTGKFAPAPLGLPKDELVLKPCSAPNATPAPYPVSYRKMVAGITGLQSGIWPNPSTGKFDLALFALGLQQGQVSWIAHTIGFNFDPAKNFALGANVKAFAVRDVNFDAHMQVDVLALLGVDLSYLPGAVLSDGKTGFFDNKVTLAEGAQQADWLDAADVNGDGFQDFVLLNKSTATLELWLGVGRSPTPLSAQFVHYPGKLRAAMEAKDTDLADMDGDGCVDIVVRSRRAVTVLHNEGVGCSGAMRKK